MKLEPNNYNQITTQALKIRKICKLFSPSFAICWQLLYNIILFQSAKKLIECGSCVYIKLMMKISPTQVNPSFESTDSQQHDIGYLMVLIQILMWNEQEVSKFCDL